jgi:hypothetical protein
MCSADAEGTLVRDGPRILLHGLLILKLKEVAAPLLVQRWVEEPAKVSRKGAHVLTVSGQQLVAVEVGMGLSLATRLGSLLLHLLLHLLLLDAAGVRFAIGGGIAHVCHRYGRSLPGRRGKEKPSAPRPDLSFCFLSLAGARTVSACSRSSFSPVSPPVQLAARVASTRPRSLLSDHRLGALLY